MVLICNTGNVILAGNKNGLVKPTLQVLRCDVGDKVKIHLSALRPLLPELDGSYLLECCLGDIRYRDLRALTLTRVVCDSLLSLFDSSRPSGQLAVAPPGQLQRATSFPTTSLAPRL